MGICIELDDVDVVIPRENIPALMEGLRELSEKKLDWVEDYFPSLEVEEYSSQEELLVMVFGDLRYSIILTPDGIEVEEFLGEKAGSDKIIWNTLAPYVKEGSHMDWVTEDHDLYSYVFADKAMVIS